MIKMGACQSHEQHNNVEGELKSISDTISLVKSVVMSSEESEVSELARRLPLFLTYAILLKTTSSV